MRDPRDIERHSISGLHLVQAVRAGPVPIKRGWLAMWREFFSGQKERATKAFRRFQEQVKGRKLNSWKT